MVFPTIVIASLSCGGERMILKRLNTLVLARNLGVKREEFGSQLAFIFRLFCICITNFCKSLVGIAQELHAMVSVSSESEASQIGVSLRQYMTGFRPEENHFVVMLANAAKCARNTALSWQMMSGILAWFSGVSHMRVMCLSLAPAAHMRGRSGHVREVKSLARSTVAWLVRGWRWLVNGGCVGRSCGIIAHLGSACQELLANQQNKLPWAAKSPRAVVNHNNSFLHASTPARLSHLRRFHAMRNNSLAKQNKGEQCRIIGATVAGSCAKASAHWQRLSCAATMQQWHASMHATHIAFPLSTYTVFLFQLGRHPLTTATSEAQGKRSGLRGVVAVVGLAVPTKEKNDLPVGYLSSRNHAQQAAILLGARTSNTRPDKFTGERFKPLPVRFYKDKERCLCWRLSTLELIPSWSMSSPWTSRASQQKSKHFRRGSKNACRTGKRSHANKANR
jgi:hypothetical protein